MGSEMCIRDSLMSISNTWRSMTPQQFADIFGIPNASAQWGTTIFDGLMRWMQRHRVSHPQSNAIASYWSQGMWGWFWADGGGRTVSHALAESPLMDSGFGLQCYPCWYDVEGGWCRMLCFHLIIYGMRLWWVHPTRISPADRASKL